MKDNRKVHLLAQELIPVMNDLDEEPQQIILDHIQECEDCKQLYTTIVEFDENMPALNYSDDVELKPLKKLAQFNAGLKLLLIAVRSVILFYILYSTIRFSGMESLDIGFIESAILLFYMPAALFLLIFTYTFFNKKWAWGSLIVDLFVILLLGKVLHLFL